MISGFLNLSLSKIKESFRAIAKNLQVFVEANYSREDPSTIASESLIASK